MIATRYEDARFLMLCPQSEKSYTQKMGDSLSGNSNQNEVSICGVTTAPYVELRK